MLQGAITAIVTPFKDGKFDEAAYRELIYETPALLEYWQQATPIREISRLRIGSRPARRPGYPTRRRRRATTSSSSP